MREQLEEIRSRALAELGEGAWFFVERSDALPWRR